MSLEERAGVDPEQSGLASTDSRQGFAHAAPERVHVNLLRERIAPVSDGTWPEGIGSWGDIYDDEIKKSMEYEGCSRLLNARRRQWPNGPKRP